MLRCRTLLPRALALAALGVAALARAGETIPDSPAAIRQELRSFATLGSVLYVAAHPDDENTQLITYLARGRGYRTAYLSVTRGDGGQNEIGPEFGEKLGLARTYELLAARQLDGGRQFFTRALDFGYSKDVNETLRIWDRQQVLADIVRVYRTYRPDVVVAGFSTQQTPNQHGQHVASAVLAGEAYKLSGDPKAFPEQLAEGLQPWHPKRLLLNVRGRADAPNLIRIEAGGSDPVTGEGFGSIAARSRAMHKTQGFGNFAAAQNGGAGPRTESFSVLDGDPAKDDIVDGLDLTFARFPGGADLVPLIDAAINSFKLDDPAASVPALLEIRAKLAVLKGDPVLAEKRAQLDRILRACLGLRVETTVAHAEVVPGEKITLRETVSVKSSVPVRWVSLSVNSPAGISISDRDGSLTGESVIELPVKAAPSQPYWISERSTPGMFRVARESLVGRPLNQPAISLSYTLSIGGQLLTIDDEPVELISGAPTAQQRRPLVIVPPVALSFAAESSPFVPGSTKTILLDVKPARTPTSGTARLIVPAGWTVTPASRPFTFSNGSDDTHLAFEVTAPAQVASAEISAEATVGKTTSANGHLIVNYAHLPLQEYFPAARLKAIALDLKLSGHTVGYIPGAGDSIAEALEQMGCTVKRLSGPDLTPEKLHGLDAVVIGVRAFNVRTDLADHLAGLYAWVEAGGTVIAQYNRPDGGMRLPLGPYDLSIDGPAPRLRVTDENAPVSFLAADHPALNFPNKIGPADFVGWVQERGAYFPSKWDEAHYVPLLAMSDPDEPLLKSSVLVAKHGKGYYVYTGLAFFRQLPAGVPGAYRLFANLVSLGKE